MTSNLRINLIAIGVIMAGAATSPADGRAAQVGTGEGTYCEYVGDFLFCPPNGMALICGSMGYPSDFGICIPSLIEGGVYSWYCCRHIN